MDPASCLPASNGYSDFLTPGAGPVAENIGTRQIALHHPADDRSMTATAPPAQPAPSPFEPGVSLSVETGDPTLLGDALPGWEVEYIQLGHGRFHGHIELGQTARMQFLSKDWNMGMLVRGIAPPGISVLGGPLTDGSPARVRGLPIANNEIGFVRPGLEVEFRNLDACHLFMIALPEQLLEQHAIALLGRPLSELTRGSRLRTRRDHNDLRAWFTQLNLAALCREPERLADPLVAGWIENRVLDGLIEHLATDDRPTFSKGGVKLARLVDAYLRSNLQTPLTIRDLCTALNVPERTLHKAVSTHLGVTPKALLKTMRLNAVRQALRTAPPGTGVMEIAMQWGFFHAGWFSQDYRQQFGESPSTTLRNGVTALSR